jgi:hypothetical protein
MNKPGIFARKGAYEDMKKTIPITLAFGFLAFVVLSLSGARGADPQTWKAIILPGGNLIGDSKRDDSSLGGSVYDDSEVAVEVYATIGTINSHPRQYRTIFHMNVNFPEYVRFSGIMPSFFEFLKFDSNPGFPTGTLFEFLNNKHPYDGQYLAIQFGFFGDYTADRSEADWTSMAIGERKPMRMYVEIVSRKLIADCSECDLTNYHTIEINSFDAVITRTGANEWIISVTANFDQIPNTLTYPNSYTEYEFIADKYCVCQESKVHNKTYTTKAIDYASWGYGNFSFAIKFVLN